MYGIQGLKPEISLHCLTALWFISFLDWILVIRIFWKKICCIDMNWY